MANEGIDIFRRWVHHHGLTSERVRPYLTLATVLSDDETLMRLHGEACVAPLDEALLEEFLSLADPRETVALLTFRIGPLISPEMFLSVVERTVAASSDMNVLSGLMFVAGLYLDRHPGAFRLPRNLADQLLASEDLDGLKALRHTLASPTEIVAQIVRALKRDDWQEKWGGLAQLRNVLEDGTQLAEAAEQEAVSDLLNVLAQIADTDSDDDARRVAGHFNALLRAGGTDKDLHN